METIKSIKNVLSNWFAIQNDCEDAISPEEVIRIAKLCTALDVAQVFLGYDDEEMSKVDDVLRDICNNFIEALNKVDKIHKEEEQHG